MKKSLYQTIQYLTDSSSDLLKNCKVTTTNGITIFTPDGVSSYNALWLRDFSYMVEYAGDCISMMKLLAVYNTQLTIDVLMMGGCLTVSTKMVSLPMQQVL